MLERSAYKSIFICLLYQIAINNNISCNNINNNKVNNLIEKRNNIIVKCGGSAFTKKSSFETLNIDNIAITAYQLREITISGKTNVILVHGAGSFGHFQAKTYGLSNIKSIMSNDGWVDGLVLTRQSVLILNKVIVNSFILADIPAVSVSLFPSTITKGKNNVIVNGALDNIFTLIANNFTPVIHGDVVLDDLHKCSIISGDTIVLWLCQQSIKLNQPKIDYVVFLTDVEGIYDKPPHFADAQLIKSITVSLDGTIKFPETDKLDHDVTGGIRQKLEVAIEIAKLGIKVFIVKAGSEDAFEVLKNRIPSECTIIYPPIVN